MRIAFAYEKYSTGLGLAIHTRSTLVASLMKVYHLNSEIGTLNIKGC